MEATKRKGTHEMDMTTGPILKKLIIFSLPIIGVNLLQLLFNIADVAVLGMFSTDQAVAAVGSTTSLVSLLTGFFIGLSLGSNVLIARCAGAKDPERAKKFVGTSIFISLLFGIIITIIGLLGARTFLIWMNCDPAVLDLATTYLRIYFIGMPVIMLYNFTTAILRAVGDTMRPLIFLTIGGVVNVGLNIFFILVLNMDVAGVAIATISSQAVTAICSFIVLLKSKGYASLEKKYFRIFRKELSEILKVGVPMGVTKCLFAFSNVIIQSSINGFGDLAMSANSIAHEFDVIINELGHGFAYGALSFVSQNLGAGKYNRIKKTLFVTILTASVACIITGGLMILFARPLVGIMTDTEEVIRLAVERLYVFCSTYFLCAIMCTFQEVLRGLGRSFTSMVISLTGACVFRIIWLNTGYYLWPTLTMIYLTYLLSWVLTIIMYIIATVPMMKRIKRELSLKAQEHA